MFTTPDTREPSNCFDWCRYASLLSRFVIFTIVLTHPVLASFRITLAINPRLLTRMEILGCSFRI